MVIAVIVGISGPMSGQVERHEDHGRTLLHTSRSPNVAVADASCGDGKAASARLAHMAAHAFVRLIWDDRTISPPGNSNRSCTSVSSQTSHRSGARKSSCALESLPSRFQVAIRICESSQDVQPIPPWTNRCCRRHGQSDHACGEAVLSHTPRGAAAPRRCEADERPPRPGFGPTSGPMPTAPSHGRGRCATPQPAQDQY